MKKNLACLLAVFCYCQFIHAQYSETFDIPNKGILSPGCTGPELSTCSNTDFSGVNWTLGGDLSGIDTEGFLTTVNPNNGTDVALFSEDIDAEACWISPVLVTNSGAGTMIEISVDYWVQLYDVSDYLNVEYQIDGSTWIQIPNQAGGGSGTVQGISSNQSFDGTVNSGILTTTNPTILVRVCFDHNSSAEETYIDNIIVTNVNPESTVTPKFPPLGTLCEGSGIQTITGGATPEGGIYSGNGVTDSGNGTTFSFDPSITGVGSTSITYTLEGNSASSTLTVAALPSVTFTSSLTSVGIDAGVQTGLSGGSPMGGIYSGPGVTDDGNGMTFSFDPAAAGAGDVIVTYTFTDANGCSDNQSDVITVESLQFPGDACADAIGINSLFGGPINTPQISDIQDNTDYNPENDPGSGYECWSGDAPVLNNTMWFAFTGDGEQYTIRSLQCDTINPMTNTDTQFALYSGDCTTPVAVACNDDEDFDNQDYNSFLDITTEVGTDYLLMVDGYVAAGDYAAIGSYCLEVTRLETVGVQDIRNTEFKVYPNPTNSLVQLAGFTADHIEVLDQIGRVVHQQAQAGNGCDLSSLPAGIYVLRMTSGEEVYSAKVVKE